MRFSIPSISLVLERWICSATILSPKCLDVSNFEIVGFGFGCFGFVENFDDWDIIGDDADDVLLLKVSKPKDEGKIVFR